MRKSVRARKHETHRYFRANSNGSCAVNKSTSGPDITGLHMQRSSWRLQLHGLAIWKRGLVRRSSNGKGIAIMDITPTDIFLQDVFSMLDEPAHFGCQADFPKNPENNGENPLMRTSGATDFQSALLFGTSDLPGSPTGHYRRVRHPVSWYAYAFRIRHVCPELEPRMNRCICGVGRRGVLAVCLIPTAPVCFFQGKIEGSRITRKTSQ